jgi:hypothetical protein
MINSNINWEIIYPTRIPDCRPIGWQDEGLLSRQRPEGLGLEIGDDGSFFTRYVKPNVYYKC